MLLPAILCFVVVLALLTWLNLNRSDAAPREPLTVAALGRYSMLFVLLYSLAVTVKQYYQQTQLVDLPPVALYVPMLSIVIHLVMITALLTVDEFARTQKKILAAIKSMESRA